MADLLLFFRVHLFEYIFVGILAFLAPILLPSAFHTYDEIGSSQSFKEYLKAHYIKDLGKTLSLSFIVLTTLIFLLSFIKVFATNETIFFICFAICFWAFLEFFKKSYH